MKQELAEALLDFYRTVLQPDLQRIDDKLAEHEGHFSQVLGNFDKTFQRFDRLEDEYHAIVHGLDRVDEAVRDAAAAGKTMDARLENLEERTARLEARSAT